MKQMIGNVLVAYVLTWVIINVLYELISISHKFSDRR